MGIRDEFDLTPQQYHEQLDKLWQSVPGILLKEDETIFDGVCQTIRRLRRVALAVLYCTDPENSLASAMHEGPERDELQEAFDDLTTFDLGGDA